jgi:hypothetical protein
MSFHGPREDLEKFLHLSHSVSIPSPPLFKSPRTLHLISFSVFIFLSYLLYWFFPFSPTHRRQRTAAARRGRRPGVAGYRWAAWGGMRPAGGAAWRGAARPREEFLKFLRWICVCFSCSICGLVRLWGCKRLQLVQYVVNYCEIRRYCDWRLILNHVIWEENCCKFWMRIYVTFVSLNLDWIG